MSWSARDASVAVVRSGSITGGLVGRTAELAAVRGALRLACDGVPVLLTLRGDPGIGKTALLDLLAAEAEAAGASVCAGRAAEAEREVPLAAVGDLVDGLAALGQVASGSSDVRDLPADSPTGRYQAGRAVARLLGAAAGRRPVVLLLDDAHVADDASLDLLQHLLRRPPAGRWLIAVAYRPRQAPGRLAGLAGAVARGVSAAAVEVGPLAPEETRALALSAGVPAAAAPALHEAASGNPWYVLALAPAWQARASLAPADVLAELPPEAVRSVLAELTGLTEAEWRTLRAAAVLGEVFEPDLLTTLLGEAGSAGPVPSPRPAPDQGGGTAAELDALVGRDLVRGEPDGRRLRFRHPLLRAVVYRAAPPAWRLEVHRRAAAELGRRGAATPVVAEHLARVAVAGDPAAATLLTEAAAETVSRDPARAAGWLALARRLTGGRDRDRAGLLLTEAQARAAAGQLRAARDLAADALVRLPAADPRRTPAALLCAAAERTLGQYDAACALLDAELDRTPLDRPGDRAALAEQAAASALLRRSDQAVRLAAVAVAEAARDGDPGVRAAAAGTAALVAACYGPAEEAGALVEGAAAFVDGLPDEALPARQDPMGQVAWAEMLLGRESRALRHFARAADAADRSGRTHLSASLLLGRCCALLQRGLLGPALEAADEAEAAVRAIDSQPLLGAARTLRAAALLWRDGPEPAARTAEDAAALLGDPDHDRLAAYALRLLARQRLLLGDPVSARALLLHSAGGPGLPTAEACCRDRWTDLLAEIDAVLAEGHPTAADPAPVRTRTGYTLLAASWATEDPAKAADLAGDAALLFAEDGHPLDEARAWLAAAAHARRHGAWEAAERCLVRVRGIADRCGARWLGEVALAAQRGVSGLAGRMTSPAAGDLTRREEAIADLLVSGLSNAEIAGRLHLTVKTIEAHLTRIYRKLGVRSRSAAAAMLSRAAR